MAKAPVHYSNKELTHSPKKANKEELLKEGYYRLGKLATEFAWLEQIVYALLQLFYFNDERGNFLLKGNNLEKNLHLLEQIANYKDFWRKEIEKAIESIRQIKAERNSLIHGYWKIMFTVDTDEPVIIVSSFDLKTIYDKSNVVHKKGKIVSLKDTTEKKYSYQDIGLMIMHTQEIATTLSNVYVALQMDKNTGRFK